MDEAFDGIFDLHEGAKGGHIGNRTSDFLANGVALFNGVPWVGQQAAQAQTDTFAAGVDFDNHHLYLLAGGEDFAGMIDPLP